MWGLAPMGALLGGHGAGGSGGSGEDGRGGLEAGPLIVAAAARPGIRPGGGAASGGGGSGGGVEGGGLPLSPGETAPLFLHLIPPTLMVMGRRAAAGGGGGGDLGSTALPTSLVDPPLPGGGLPPAIAGRLDLTSPGGLLLHLLSAPRPAAGLGAKGNAAAKQQQRGSRHEASVAGGGSSSSSGGAAGPLAPADPPVDLVVAWQVAVPGDGQQVRVWGRGGRGGGEGLAGGCAFGKRKPGRDDGGQQRAADVGQTVGLVSCVLPSRVLPSPIVLIPIRRTPSPPLRRAIVSASSGWPT